MIFPIAAAIPHTLSDIAQILTNPLSPFIMMGIIVIIVSIVKAIVIKNKKSKK